MPKILVKLRAPMVQTIEAALPSQNMALSAGAAKSAQINTFLSRYSARTLKPLYPELIRAKRLRGLTDFQLADGIRQKFVGRARRIPANFHPPEISRTYVMDLDPTSGKNLEQTLKELNSDPAVEFAEPEHVYQANLIPNDPYFSSTGTWGQSYDDLWGIKKIGSASAWDTNTGTGVIVAVVDTGIDYNHPDIAPNVWINTGEIPNNGIDDDHNGFVDDVRGWNFSSNTNDPIDHIGHGTHVAGTIAALGNNGIGVIGVAWHAQVMAVKGLDDAGSGSETTLAPAIIYAANNGADVINASWGGQSNSQTIEDAIKYAYSLGVVFVAAAGNFSEDAVNFFPASSPEAITVSASNALDNLASFSNFGPKIDVAAPGEDILSLQAAGSFLGPVVSPGYCRLSGTSMAAPHAAGVAALVLSQNPAYSPEQVRQVLRASATDIGPPGWDPYFGYGRVNAAAALAIPSVLQVHITSPVPGTHISNPVTISGLAAGNNFDHYVLDYGPGIAPATWTILQSSANPVSGGVLGTFDPGTLLDGVYTIRLTAYDNLSHVFSDRLELTVQYSTITSPTVPQVPVTALEFKPGVLLQVVGTATGANFQDFRLQWAEGIHPSSGWSSAGMTLTGGGTTQITNGSLGSWNTTGITQADYYSIRLLVDNTNLQNQAETLVYLEPDLLSPNWPQPLTTAPTSSSGFVPVTDGAGNTHLALETPIYLGSPFPGEFLTFSPDGSSVTATQLPFGSHFNPAAGDMDGYPGDETVVPDDTDIRIVRSDNTFYTLQPSPTLGKVELPDNQVVLEDVEGNSQLDVVALGDNFAGTAYVFVWKRDGSLLNSNFPLSIPDQNPYIFTGLNYTPRVLVGDINGDGYKELLVMEGLSSSTFTLKLFAHDGTPLTWSVPVFDGYPQAIALADLDHNGKLEVILRQYPGSGSQDMVHVFQPDGSERLGWPQTINSSADRIVVGDLDRNGTEEIVVPGYNKLYVFEADGTSFSNAWPRLDFQYGPVALADIDGDGYPEILVMQVNFVSNQVSPPGAMNGETTPGSRNLAIQKQVQCDPGAVRCSSTTQGDWTAQSNFYLGPKLLALRRDATVAKSWNMLGMSGEQPYSTAGITVGDFNHDGITDIALSYFTITGGDVGGPLLHGVATVLSTGGAFNAAVNDWPMMFHDARNTDVLRRNVLLATNTTLNVSGGINQSIYGQTVTFQAVASSGTGADTPTGTVDFLEMKQGPVLLARVPLSNGVASFTTSSFSAGSHTIIAVYSGDTAFQPSNSSVWSQIINPAPLTVTANNKTRLYGTANPVLDGVITGIVNGDLLAATYNTPATLSSPVGSYPIVPTPAGRGLSNYSVTLNNGTLKVVNLIMTMQIVTGKPPFQHISLRVTVAGSGVVPTGTVTFKEGTTVLGGNALNNGSSSLDVSQLSLGKHVITMDYSGDGNYSGTTSDPFVFYRSPRPH